MSINGEHRLNDDNPSIDTVIAYVKEEFKNILAKRKDLIIKLGEAFERKASDSESVCEEIKNALHREIVKRAISRRDIERYCLKQWKKKTKPYIDHLPVDGLEPFDISNSVLVMDIQERRAGPEYYGRSVKDGLKLENGVEKFEQFH